MSVTVLVLLGMLAGDFALGRAVLGERLPAGEPVRIRVTGQQFWWHLEYDDGVPSRRVVTANEITVPVGKPIELELRSKDVIHSFWLPALAGKKENCLYWWFVVLTWVPIYLTIYIAPRLL